MNPSLDVLELVMLCVFAGTFLGIAVCRAVVR